MTKAKSKVTDILSLIEADHRQVEQLFEQFESTKGAKKLRDCFHQIYKELTLHAQAEELVFYPAMQEYDETKAYIEDAEEEHNAVKILLEQMRHLKPGDDEFTNQMMHLKESVMHHVEEEESEIFDAVRDCMEDEELQNLGQEFQQTKTRLEPEIAAAMA